MTTGQKIYECRKKLSMTQEELAERLGVTRQSVSKWESDGAFPETEKILELCKLFGLSADELLFGEAQTEKSGSAEEPEHCSRGWGVIKRGDLHFEYVSKKRLWGMPLVHVNFGLGLYRAKGIIAVGNIATGLISFGTISVGLLAFGALALGLLVFGAFAMGGISFGGVAAGMIAFGGLAIGVYAIGGLSVGYWTVGGFARGYYAFGDWAIGWLSVGETRAAGVHAFEMPAQFQKLCRFAETTFSAGRADFVKWIASLLRPS